MIDLQTNHASQKIKNSKAHENLKTAQESKSIDDAIKSFKEYISDLNAGLSFDNSFEVKQIKREHNKGYQKSEIIKLWTSRNFSNSIKNDQQTSSKEILSPTRAPHRLADYSYEHILDQNTCKYVNEHSTFESPKKCLRSTFHVGKAYITKIPRFSNDLNTLKDINVATPKIPSATRTANRSKNDFKCENPHTRRRKKSTVSNSNSNSAIIYSSILPDSVENALSKNIHNCDLEIGASPQRCAWGHSSFRTPRTDKHLKNQSPLVRRTASMTASDNDVSIRSVTDSCKEFCQNQLQHRIPVFDNQNAKLTTNRVVISNLKLSQGKKEIMEELTTSGATAWGNSFERMLEDPFGLHTFAEFLKKEFSAENIYFWTACERYRQLENKSDRSVQALSIFNKHLGDGAIEPVNVDSHARNLSEEKLKSAEIDIFLPAQKQIFNLMKFDSYQRFIRSDLYKSCLEAEQKKQPLPYRMEDFDELLQTHSHQNSLSKLKKSASNAEDRRRKSLLPWHRKMRSKSRDRESENSKSIICKVPQLAVNSLKIPSVFQSNSISDIHSSRSSLSSFDALPSAHIGNQVDVHSSESITCSLCRVILSDGATTIVQIRPDDTVRQLVERLLEKRGLIYKFYDVVINGSAKSIDLQNSAAVIAGKEVLIEQRVAFKLDLPDPKVISVKSKPKKQLQEVVRPILLKYNYSIDNVHVVFRDTHEMVDLSLPVTIVDGQRLQIIQIEKPNTSKYSKQCLLKSSSFPIKVDQLSFISEEKSNIYSENTGQTTLDEITNKVFSELLQGKVEAHASNKRLSIPPNDVCSLKSDDYVSESSSLFNRIREKNNQGLIPKNKFFCNQSTEENVSNFKSTILTDGGISQAQATEIKKPIIAKLKAGVKVQVTERMTENQDELLEGLKRAQLARLEDQRGTEINFELPDFLKNKENMSEAASNLRKVRANLSPISKQITLHEPISSLKDLPQPAPRFSITNKKSTSIFSKNCDLQSLQPQIQPDKSGVPVEVDIVLGGKSPPPLPPKPKVLPTKPSNWGVSPVIGTSSSSLSLSSKIPLSDHSRKTQLSNERCYIEETSSSFV